MGDDAEVQILLRWKEENAAAHAEVMRKITEIAAAQTAANAATAASATPLRMSAAAWGGFAAAALLALPAVTNLVPLIVSSTIALVSFAVAGAGTLALMGGIAAGFAAIAGAVFLMGSANAGGLNPAAEMMKTQKALESAVKEHAAALKELQQVQAGLGADIYGPGLSKAQMLNLARTYVDVTAANVADAQRNLAEPMSGLNGPIAKLGTALDDMRDHFERVSRPIADSIAAWLLPFVSSLQTAGDALAKWFGERLPAVLSGMGVVIRNLTPDFQAFYSFLGGVADKVGPQMAGVFQGAVQNFLIPAATGLINNLVRLSDWFQKELPTLGPVVQQVLGGMGSVVQFVASTWAKWNDWIVANWKPTIDQAKKDWDNIANGWKGVDFTGLTNGLIGIGQAIKGIGDFAAGAMGGLGPFIKALQDWANNNSFWAGLQGHLIDIANAIRNIPPFPGDTGTIWAGGPRSDVPYSAPSGTARTNPNAPVLGGGRSAPTNNTNITINGVDTNNADLVSRTIARNLRKLGVT